MIHLIHGEALVASRNELSELKKRYAEAEVVVFDGRTLTPTEFIQATQSTSLFALRRVVVVENLFSKRLNKAKDEKEQFIKLIGEISEEIVLILWEEKELAKTVLFKLPKNTDTALFKPHRIIFKFVEAIQPGYTGELIDLFEECVRVDREELIFVMLVRQVRYLIMAKDLGRALPDLSSWQISKIMKQGDFFTTRELYNLYHKLYDIEVRIKTGSSPFSLTQELKLFLISV